MEGKVVPSQQHTAKIETVTARISLVEHIYRLKWCHAGQAKIDSRGHY